MRYGPATTRYNRFMRWRKLGVWDCILAAVSQAYECDLQMIDSSSIRVIIKAQRAKRDSQDAAAGHGAGARRMWRLHDGLPPRSRSGRSQWPADHALTDRGQANDGRSAVDMLETVSDD
jgi:hypothetical protein